MDFNHKITKRDTEMISKYSVKSAIGDYAAHKPILMKISVFHVKKLGEKLKIFMCLFLVFYECVNSVILSVTHWDELDDGFWE